MLEDLRDEELGRLLDEWASSIEPDLRSPIPDSPTRRPRGDRVVRVTASIAVAAIFVAVAAWGLAVVGRGNPHQTEGPIAPSLKTYIDPGGIPITLEYPPDWFASTESGFKAGVNVVNDRRETPNALDRSDNDFFGTHIRDAVGVTVFKAPNHAPTATDSTFPFDMTDAKVDLGWGQESVRYLNAQVAGVPIRITVYAAKDASPEDIAAADAIVASIRPTGSSASPFVPPSSSQAGVAATSAMITHDVPGRVVRLAAISANQRVCNVGSIDRPTRLGATTFADALALLPGSDSLASYVGSYAPSTPVYDITYQGTCMRGGRTVHLIEVLVVMPSGGFPAQVGLIAKYDKSAAPRNPFSNRWESCHRDWGCGDSPSPSTSTG